MKFRTLRFVAVLAIPVILAACSSSGPASTESAVSNIPTGKWFETAAAFVPGDTTLALGKGLSGDADRSVERGRAAALAVMERQIQQQFETLRGSLSGSFASGSSFIKALRRATGDLESKVSVAQSETVQKGDVFTSYVQLAIPSSEIASMLDAAVSRNSEWAAAVKGSAVYQGW